MSAVLKESHRLRPMQMEDLDVVMTIEPHIYTHPWTLGNFKDSLNSGYSAWVLEDVTNKGEIIAYALMMKVLDESHLLNISVAKQHQKQGFGRRMLHHMMEVARGYGASHMFLEVRASNRNAIAMYEQVGFNEMSIRRAYYPAKEGREDAILMGVALSLVPSYYVE